MVQKWKHGFDKDSWYRHGLMVQNRTYYRHGRMVQTWTQGLDMDSWYRHGLMVLAKIHGMDIMDIDIMDIDLWY